MTQEAKKEDKPRLTVYEAIAKVQEGLAKDGIGKDRENKQQGYSFRGIDDVYNALAPLLSANGLCILPRVMNRQIVERTNKNGTPLFYVTVEVEFDFVSAGDGSKHTVKTFGEAMDSGDKATNKAMSAAYKYACLQAFCIPTEGDNDADATTHEVAPKVTSAFDSPAVRQMFLDNTSIAFDGAETKLALKELGLMNGEKLKAARASGDPEDAKVATVLEQRYIAKMKSFPKEESNAATVEQALDKVLGNDRIEH